MKMNIARGVILGWLVAGAAYGAFTPPTQDQLKEAAKEPRKVVALVKDASVDEADLKTRFVRCAPTFQIGTVLAGRAFVHAQLRLLAGRSPEAKQDLAGRVASVLRRVTPRPDGVMVQLSVEIVDMDRPSYVKERL